MRSSDLTSARWRKSSRSNGGGDGDCVEVAELRDQVAMRDSKNPTGPVLAFTRTEWRAFLGPGRRVRLSEAIRLTCAVTVTAVVRWLRATRGPC